MEREILSISNSEADEAKSEEKRLDAAGVPLPFRSRGFAAYAPQNDSQREALNAAMEWAAGNVPRLLLHGHMGSGKTHLAIAAVSALVREKKQALFVTMSDMVDKIRAAMDGSIGGDRDVLEWYRNIDYLAIDEVGVRNCVSGFVAETLLKVISHRDLHDLPTLITSNHSPRDLADRLSTERDAFEGALIADRLRGRVVYVTGKSMRGRQVA